MSPDPSPTGRRVLLGLAGAVVALTLAGCAADAEATPPSSSAAATEAAVPADDVTRQIAEVEFAQQCGVTTLSFPDESAITAALDARLAAAGLTHQQWKDWHDALDVSSDLVAQLTQVSAPGCPAG